MDPNHFSDWLWWIVGGVLIVLDMLSRQMFMLWMGIASGIVGFILLLEPSLGWQYQFMVFAVFSIVSIAAWRLYRQRRPIPADRSPLHRRGEQYMGRQFTLQHPIVNGTGEIRVDDLTWKIQGEDCDAGSVVTVTGLDGIILQVEKH